MGLLGNMFKGNAKEAINKFAGNTDYLEGMAAACALTAAAEGGIDDAEFEKTLTVIRSNTAISSAFTLQQIESTFSRMTPKTATRSGKSELKAEIAQVIARDKTGEMGKAILLACLDVADEGGIGPQEETVMRSIADICNVSYDKLAAG